FLNMAGLFLTQKIARAANIKVMACQLESSAKRIKRLKNLQAALRRCRQCLIDWQREERKGTHLRATYASTQLIELRQAKHISAVHNHRIGRWNVETRFHNCGRQKHVIFAVVEGIHNVFE